MIRFLLTLGLVAMAALPAQASLIGTQVRGQVLNPRGEDLFASIPQPVTVKALGGEFSAFGVEADFQADRLVLTFTSAPGNSFIPAPFRFEFLAPTVVTLATVQPGGTISFLVEPALANNVLTFTSADTPIGNTGSASVTILLETRAPGAVPVPVPGALALFGAALLGLAAAARRRPGSAGA
jgi:hypothetical protein